VAQAANVAPKPQPARKPAVVAATPVMPDAVAAALAALARAPQPKPYTVEVIRAAKKETISVERPDSPEGDRQ
jgi:hypothetical protein